MGRAASARHASCKWRVGSYVIPYRGASLIRNNHSLGPYIRTMPRALHVWRSKGGAQFLMSEVPL